MSVFFFLILGPIIRFSFSADPLCSNRTFLTISSKPRYCPVFLPLCDPFCSNKSCAPSFCIVAYLCLLGLMCSPTRARTHTHVSTMLNKGKIIKRKSSFTYNSFRVCNIEMSGPTFKLNFFIFLNTQQNKHCLEARSPGGKSNVERSHFFLFLMLFIVFFLPLSTT